MGDVIVVGAVCFWVEERCGDLVVAGSASEKEKVLAISKSLFEVAESDKDDASVVSGWVCCVVVI